MKDKPNKVTAVLKVVVTGEFYDDDATEETLRYAVEQDLEDAGFDVEVAMLKEQGKSGCDGCIYKGSDNCPLDMTDERNFICPNGKLNIT